MSLRSAYTPMSSGDKNPYQPGETVFESDIPGVHNDFIIWPGDYEIIATAGGGSGGTNCPSVTGGGGGGSGGTIKGKMTIKKKMIVILKVGRGGPSPAAQYWLPGINGDKTSIEFNGEDIVKGSPGKGCSSGGGPCPATDANSYNPDYFIPTANIRGTAGENGNKYRQGYGAPATYLGYGKGADGGGLPGPAAIGGYLKIIRAIK